MPNEGAAIWGIRKLTKQERLRNAFVDGFSDADDEGDAQPCVPVWIYGEAEDEAYRAGYRAGKKALREALAAYMKEMK